MDGLWSTIKVRDSIQDIWNWKYILKVWQYFAPGDIHIRGRVESLIYNWITVYTLAGEILEEKGNLWFF